MVTDSKAPEGPSALDLPPSYEYVATAPISEGSSSGPGPRAPPKETLIFFQPPEHAEPLFGHKTTPEETLASIRVTQKGKHLVSTDSRLQNPNVLYDWIRYRALVQPKLTMHCVGAHFDTPLRDEVVQDRDGTRHRRKGQPERIIDFDFTIDLSPVYTHTENFANIHLITAKPDDAHPRGTPFGPCFAASYSQANHTDHYAPLLGPTDPGAAPDKAYVALCAEWAVWRSARGLPPWKAMKETPEFWEDRGKGKGNAIALTDSPDPEANADGDLSQASLRDWCEKYTADRAWLKSFCVPVGFWGWNKQALQTAVEGAIKSTGYTSNDIRVSFDPEFIDITVCPPNLLSKAINTTWIYVLLWMTLLYPVIWIWQRLHTLGGGQYAVAAINNGMKYYPPLPSTFPSETLEAASARLGGMYKMHSELPKPAQLAYGPHGVHYLLGRKEGEWFREWEERIRMGVRMRYRGALEGGGEEEAGAGLDGY